VISTHRRGSQTVAVLVVAASLCAVLGVVLVLAGLVKGVPPCVVGGALALVAAAGALLGLVWYLRVTPAEVRVYPFGIKWRARGRTFEYDWDEVEEVYRSEIITISEHGRSRDAYLLLCFEDGTRLKCSNVLKRYDDLAGLVMASTANALLAKARPRLKDGVRFGPVELDDEGVTIKGDFFPFRELRQTRVRNGWVIFYFPRKEKYEFPLSRVPNYLVLFALLEELGKGGIVDQRPDPD
jgi:hypothetical protein